MNPTGALNVALARGTVTRLQRHAEPLFDTFDTVINRALDALEQVHGVAANPQAESEIRAFNSTAPPNLLHTTLKAAQIGDRTLKPNETYWNAVLFAVIREAAKDGLSGVELKDLINANCALGRKEDNGYRYLSDLDISVQGQDSNGAWRAIHHIAATRQIPLKVVFTWQDNPNAAFPNKAGSFSVGRIAEA